MRTSSSLLAACALAFFALPSVAHATTIVGGNSGNMTWTPAGNPYIVQGDLTVQAGATLTIQAGVQVLFASADGQASGTDTARVELIVNGTLVVNGTPGAPVSFAAQSGAGSGVWWGIELNAAATSATITNATIANAYNGITSNLAGTTLNLSSTAISSCSNACLLVAAGTPTIDALNLTTCGYGIYVTGGSPSLTHPLVYGTSSAGYYQTGAGSSTITNGTFASTGSYGVRATAGTVSLVSSVVTGATSYGIWSTSFGAVTATYTDIWGNSGNNYNSAISTGSITVNPLYAGATNYRLTSNSPARFSGMDGMDMGALPFTTDATGAMVGTLWTDTTIATGTTMIPGDLTIAPGVTLTVMPGAVLSFAASDRMQAYTDTSRSELRVLGTLDARGTSASPIQFTATGGAGVWWGIELTGTTASNMDYVTIENAYNGVSHQTTTSQTLHRSTVRACSNAAVLVASGAPSFDALTITSSGYGVYVTGGSVTLTNPLVYGTSSAGYYQTSSSASTIVNGTFASTGSYGVRATAGTVSLVDSIVTGATSYGIWSTSFGAVTATYSDIWGNSGNNYNSAVSTGCISINPNYVSASDYHLQSSSTCIDSGTATGAPSSDHDGIARPLDGDGIGGAPSTWARSSIVSRRSAATARSRAARSATTASPTAPTATATRRARVRARAAATR